jgi:hypothetical protein
MSTVFQKMIDCILNLSMITLKINIVIIKVDNYVVKNNDKDTQDTKIISKR